MIRRAVIVSLLAVARVCDVVQRIRGEKPSTTKPVPRYLNRHERRARAAQKRRKR